METAEKATPPHRKGTDGEGRDEYKPRPWVCKQCNAELGQVVRPGAVRRLEVWARPRTSDMVGEPVVVVTMTGHGEVRCGCCGYVKAWDVGGDAMQELLRRRG